MSCLHEANWILEKFHNPLWFFFIRGRDISRHRLENIDSVTAVLHVIKSNVKYILFIYRAPDILYHIARKMRNVSRDFLLHLIL